MCSFGIVESLLTIAGQTDDRQVNSMPWTGCTAPTGLWEDLLAQWNEFERLKR
jgi:hypothetical protein